MAGQPLQVGAYDTRSYAAYLAGHRDMSITKRYMHPQEHTTRAAMDRARDAQGGHKNGHKCPWCVRCRWQQNSRKELIT